MFLFLSIITATRLAVLGHSERIRKKVMACSAEVADAGLPAFVLCLGSGFFSRVFFCMYVYTCECGLATSSGTAFMVYAALIGICYILRVYTCVFMVLNPHS